VALLLTNPNTPRLPRMAVALAAVYLLMPVDLLPDFLIPVGGLLDDVVLVWVALRWMISSAKNAGVDEPVAVTRR
jgi:uncharacterized membrane protein YkvA (DUF1232 family)